MSEVDQIKESLGWLKVVFGILSALDVSLLAWLVRNFNVASIVMVVLAIISVVGTTIVIVWINYAAFRRIKQLREN